MKFFIAAVAACTFFGTVNSILAIAADKSDQIKFIYVPPDDPDLEEVYEKLKSRRVLERLKEFLKPFKLPRPLTFRLSGCDGEDDAFYGDEGPEAFAGGSNHAWNMVKLDGAWRLVDVTVGATWGYPVDPATGVEYYNPGIIDFAIFFGLKVGLKIFFLKPVRCFRRQKVGFIGDDGRVKRGGLMGSDLKNMVAKVLGGQLIGVRGFQGQAFLGACLP